MSAPMTDAERAEVEGRSYEQLLRKWRFAPLGDEALHGVRGDYFAWVMWAKKAALLPDEQVAVSKRVGFLPRPLN